MNTGERLGRTRVLIRTIRDAERELETLTPGAVVDDDGVPFLNLEAQQQLVRSETAQRELAQQQLAILNALAAHIALIDGEGVILWVNDAWRRFGQANVLEANAFGVGINYLAVCAAATSECSQEAGTAADGIRRVLKGEAPHFTLEYACHSPTENRWFRLMVTPVLEGQPGGAVVMHVNVTERRAAEASLRESLARSTEAAREQRLIAQQLEGERARLSAAQRVAKVGSWETELATGKVLWSDETHRIFETDPATFQPTHPWFLERVHPEDRAAVDAAFVNSRSAPEPCSIEHRILLPGGRGKVVEERWEIVCDDDGQPVRAHGTCHDITDRKRADEELRRSRDLLRIASSAARLGAWKLELPGRHFSFSEELIAIHDLPPGAAPTQDELIGLYSPEPREVLRRHMDACLREGTPYDVELPKRTATGRQIWVRSIGEAMRDATGRIVGLQGAGQDVTSRKVAEQELARMNRALRLLSHCNEALVRAKSERELLDQVCRIAAEDGGYLLAWVGSAEEDAAKTISVRASAGAHQVYLDGIPLSWSADVREGGGPAGKTVRTGELVVCTDITTDAQFAFWRDRAVAHGIRSVLCFPLRGASRTFGVLCLYGGEASKAGADELKLLQELADDLAYGIVGLRAREERHRAEQRLIEQAALLDQTSEAIFVRDLEDRITYWNRGAERLYGWSSAEVVGQRAAELFHRTDAAQLAQARAAHEQVIATGAWVGEVYKFDKGGRSRLISARWSLLRGKEGQPQAVLTLNADITEKRQLETQLLRTQRLESIGTLAGGIAHDLNNVLAPILSSITMLVEDETNPEKLEDLALLEASARRGAAMVRQLLTFARGEPQGPHKYVDVLVIAGEVVKMVRDTFPKDISAVLRKGESPWAVLGNPTQLHQLLTNLCVNARDAMPSGGVLTLSLESVIVDELHAGMSAETPPGQYLRVSVEDTGTGMAPEVRDRIFEPFFTTKPVGSGTGLGLSTCHAIAHNHGGFIRVASELGKGSRFEVYLPAEVPTDAIIEVESKRGQFPLGRSELVLVVEDEEAIRKIVRRTLERYGYRVLLAANGAEALSLYAANAGAIAAVITDMSMPVMDGPTTIIALKAIDPAVRIVGTSGLDADTKATRALSLGVTHWVPKPYTADLLLRVLRAAIG